MHLIATMSPNQSGSAFMQKIKEHTAKALLPQLTDDEQTGFDHQRGLNNRSFWQRGFDSFPLSGRSAFLQKLEYIHHNPVEAGICEASEGYQWSSAAYFSEGLWNPEVGLAHIILERLRGT